MPQLKPFHHRPTPPPLMLHSIPFSRIKNVPTNPANLKISKALFEKQITRNQLRLTFSWKDAAVLCFVAWSRRKLISARGASAAVTLVRARCRPPQLTCCIASKTMRAALSHIRAASGQGCGYWIEPPHTRSKVQRVTSAQILKVCVFLFMQRMMCFCVF
jgi:hypothetical protein